METVFLRKFSKDLDNIRHKKVKKDVMAAIENVEQASDIREISKLKKLKGFDDAWRIKIGDYRIGIYINESTVEFARVVHRKDIYKVFP